MMLSQNSRRNSRQGPRYDLRLPYPLDSNNLFEISDPETIISILKALTTAAVSLIPPFLPLIIASGKQNYRPTHRRSLPNSASTSSTSASLNAFILRRALKAFLTPGGLFERLGDGLRFIHRHRCDTHHVQHSTLSVTEGTTLPITNVIHRGSGHSRNYRFAKKRSTRYDLGSRIACARREKVVAKLVSDRPSEQGEERRGRHSNKSAHTTHLVTNHTVRPDSTHKK